MKKWFAIAILIVLAPLAWAAGKLIRDPSVPDVLIAGSATLTPICLTYFPEDANTLSHVCWDGALDDDTFVGWSMIGAVPQSPSYGGPIPGSAGPFDAGDYYTAGALTLEQHADQSACVLVSITSPDTTQAIVNIDNTTDATDGHANFNLSIKSTQASATIWQDGTHTTSQLAGTATVGRHLLCFAYHYLASGSSVLRVALDNTQTVTSTAVGPPQTTSGGVPFLIGRRMPNVSPQPWLGSVYEEEFWSRALSSTDLTSIYNTLHAAGVI